MLPLAFNFPVLQQGIFLEEGWDLASHPHLLITGSTGSGKSYALRLLIGKAAKYLPEVRLILCDFKNELFPNLTKEQDYYPYQQMMEGITLAESLFHQRLAAANPKENTHKILLILDEYVAFLNFLEKKEADLVKKTVGNLLMMGRSLGIHLVIGIQRADAEFFRHGSREQFGSILALGNISKEYKNMLFSDYKDEMEKIQSQGQGYWLRDGQGLVRVQIPRIQRPDALLTFIQKYQEDCRQRRLLGQQELAGS